MPPVNIRVMINSDHAYVDLTTTVTVRQPNGVEFIALDVVRFNRGYDWGSVAEAELPGGVVTFGLWVEQCSQRPKLSARLTDSADGVKYRVIRVEDVAANSRYDVACTPEVEKKNV